MKVKFIFIIVSLFLACQTHANQRVRRIKLSEDQIATVRTSLGIATIIQVPDRPNSMVVGDQDAFKVEYLDQAITIKPLSGGAKSNLYIYTDWKRYNVELVSGPEVTADYVVYLETFKGEPFASKGKNEIRWTKFKNNLKNESLNLTVNRLGKTKAGILLVEFVVTCKSKETFKPEWLWITQDGSTTPIHNLFLSSLEVSPANPLSGVIQIRAGDIDSNVPIKLELRKKKISYLTLLRVSSWKQ